jgi:hypothetical protein
MGMAYKIVGKATGRREEEWNVPIVKFVLIMHNPGGSDAVIPVKITQ